MTTTLKILRLINSSNITIIGLTIKSWNPGKAKMKEKLIYLASPFNHDEETVREERRRLVTVATARFMKMGFVVYSPIVHNGTVATVYDLGRHFTFWRFHDETILSRCDAMWILLIDGWDKSFGVASEIKFSKKRKIPVSRVLMPQEDDTLMKFSY
jgi:hypothetical protein